LPCFHKAYGGRNWNPPQLSNNLIIER